MKKELFKKITLLLMTLTLFLSICTLIEPQVPSDIMPQGVLDDTEPET